MGLRYAYMFRHGNRDGILKMRAKFGHLVQPHHFAAALADSNISTARMRIVLNNWYGVNGLLLNLTTTKKVLRFAKTIQVPNQLLSVWRYLVVCLIPVSHKLLRCLYVNGKNDADLVYRLERYVAGWCPGFSLSR
jgi:hypothetical protein